MRWQFGEAGLDKRGLWINDPDTGAKARIGMVGLEMAADFAARGDCRLAREVMAKPHVGFWFSKTF